MYYKKDASRFSRGFCHACFKFFPKDWHKSFFIPDNLFWIFRFTQKNLFSILKNVIIVLRKSFETKFVWLVDMFGFSEACLFKVMKSWRYISMVKMWVSHFTEVVIEKLIIPLFCESTESIIFGSSYSHCRQSIWIFALKKNA